MRKIVIIYGGAADRAQQELRDRTPLEVARCPEASRLATLGRVGQLASVAEADVYRPERLVAGLLGADAPDRAAPGRGPLLALGGDLPCSPGDFVFVANFVTLDHGRLVDGLTPRLTERETRSLMDELRPLWQAAGFDLHPAGPARLVVRAPRSETAFGSGLPPVCREGETVHRLAPAGPGEGALEDLLEQSRRVLDLHAVNEVRLDLGENPANALWLWGGGTVPEAATGSCRPGALMTNSRLGLGLARVLGAEPLPVRIPWPGEDGPRPEFKLTPAVAALRRSDRLAVYVEAPGELGRYGRTAADKVRGLEWLDRYLLAPLVAVLEAYRPYRIALVADSLVAGPSGLPESAPLPLAVSGDEVAPDECSRWDESSGTSGALGTRAAAAVQGLFEENLSA